MAKTRDWLENKITFLADEIKDVIAREGSDLDIVKEDCNLIKKHLKKLIKKHGVSIVQS